MFFNYLVKEHTIMFFNYSWVNHSSRCKTTWFYCLWWNYNSFQVINFYLSKLLIDKLFSYFSITVICNYLQKIYILVKTTVVQGNKRIQSFIRQTRFESIYRLRTRGSDIEHRIGFVRYALLLRPKLRLTAR